MIRVIVFFILTISSVSHARLLPFMSCDTLLVPESQFMRNRNLTVDVQTAQLSARMIGAHGGELIVLERFPVTTSWFSKFNISLNGIQGDPRELITVLGSNLAYYFGIRALADGRVTIPDSDEVNGAIRKLNRSLAKLGYQPIPIHFYRQASTSFNAYGFLRKFIEFGIPYADYENLQIHDAAYHLSTLIVPVELLSPVVERYQFALQFYDYVQVQRSPILAQHLSRSHFLDALVSHADVGLGNIQKFFNDRFYQTNYSGTFVLTGISGRVLGDTWDHFSFKSLSKKEMVELGINSMLSKTVHAANEEQQWKTLLEKFIREKVVSPDDANTPYQMSLPDLYAKLMKRKAELQEALQLRIREGL